jgi:ketosteroid isomerase-like protein
MNEPKIGLEQNPASAVDEFIRQINARNAAGLSQLMTDDHLFVDSLGNTVRGKDEMRKAWIAYFYMIPDFRVTIRERFLKGNAVALFGIARGTYNTGGKLLERNRWEMPAAWKAIVRDGLIAEWHVYGDNEPVRRIIADQTQAGGDARSPA